MDLVENPGDLSVGVGRNQPKSASTTLLPSRTIALGECREVLEDLGGPILLTGESGVGKTWLCERIAEVWAKPATSWIRIELAPNLTTSGFFDRIGQALHLPELSTKNDPRRALIDELSDRHADGRPMSLFVEEAHNGPNEILEELRLLTNRLGEPEGFRSMVIVGLTGMARRLESRPQVALAARIAAQIHLRPVDVEEARLLLAAMLPDHSWPWPVVETLQRDAVGNPRRLLRLAQRLVKARGRRSALPLGSSATSQALANGVPSRSQQDDRNESAPTAEISKDRPAARFSHPGLVSSRPPLRVEDGLIEVGWGLESLDSVAEVSPERPRTPEPKSEPIAEKVTPAHKPSQVPIGPEPVLDPYAAIQAWNEWRSNGDLNHLPDLSVLENQNNDNKLSTTPTGEPLGNGVAGESVRRVGGGQQVRLEEHQAFAPYSQLFSRLQSPKGND